LCLRAKAERQGSAPRLDPPQDEDEAIILLTVTTAKRKPLLKLWWHYTYGLKSRPIWQRILALVLILAAGIVVFVLPIIFFVYMILARMHVDRFVQDELKAIRLRPAY
jgi:hypothetical protein